MQKLEKKDDVRKKCGMITCIHCVCNECLIDKCDFYERFYRQED